MLHITKILKVLHTKWEASSKMPFCQKQVLGPLANYISLGVLWGAFKDESLAVRSKFRAEHSARYFTISQNVVVYFIMKPNSQVFWNVTYYYTKKPLSISLLLCT